MVLDLRRSSKGFFGKPQASPQLRTESSKTASSGSMVRSAGRPTVRVYIVRHGETDENRAGVMQGQLDTRLNAVGLAQAAETGLTLKDADLGIAFSSDLDRAVKTAEAILNYHPHVELRKHTALRERNLGELQGLQIGARLEKPPAGLESLEELGSRAIGWWNNNIEPHVKALQMSKTHSPDDVLITTHGGFVGVLLRTLVGEGKVKLGDGVNIGRCQNASVSVVEIDRTSFKCQATLVKYSDTTHLAGSGTEVLGRNADVIL